MALDNWCQYVGCHQAQLILMARACGAAQNPFPNTLMFEPWSRKPHEVFRGMADTYEVPPALAGADLRGCNLDGHCLLYTSDAADE